MTRSAGLLLYRRGSAGLEVLLAHPGGPFWAGKDLGAWSVPKGLVDPGEDPHAAALREFAEELGVPTPTPTVADLELGEVRQRGGKVVACWARAGELDATATTSNEIDIEWPPRSGRTLRIPEVDRVAWFVLDEARRRINPAQAELLDRLEARLREP
jgi:predicted NUDIX family NTP pyrophosphohydrolase